MRTFHVRVHWSKENDWSGNEDANTPEEALAKMRYKVAQKSGVPEEYLNNCAQFTVMLIL